MDAIGMRPIAVELFNSGVRLSVNADGSLSISSAPYHIEYDYDISTQWLVYKGSAARGVATSAAGWKIVKYVRDANGNITQELLSPDDSVWDNRATTVVYA